MDFTVTIEDLSSKCSFCFEEIQDETAMVKITEEIEEKFEDLVRCEFISKAFSSQICLECSEKLTISHTFKLQLEANQKLLENSLVVAPQKSPTPEETQDFIVEYLEEIEEENEEEQLVVIEKQPRRSLDRQVCPICAKHYAVSAIDDHIRRMHSEEFRFFCDHCPNKFKTKRDLINHLFTHKKAEHRKRYQCEYCENIYMKNSTLQHHIKMRHLETDEEFKCECGASFKTKLRLSYHKKIIHENGQYQCEECNKFYPSMHNLKIHISHFHKTKHPCVYCGKLVAPGSFMTRHMKTHAPASHECSICSKSFTVRETLLEHQRSVHGLGENHFCEMCGKKFGSKKVLKRHIERAHTTSEKVKCEIEGCSYSANRKDNMINHVKIHKDIDEESKNDYILRIRSMRNLSW